MAAPTLHAPRAWDEVRPALTIPSLSDRRNDVPAKPGRRVVGIAAALAGVALVAALAVGVVDRRRARAATEHGATTVRAVEALDKDGWRFSVHLPTGTESLYFLAEDPGCRSNRVHEEPARAANMRALLLERCGAATMHELRAPYRDVTESLKRLGYL